MLSERGSLSVPRYHALIYHRASTPLPPRVSLSSCSGWCLRFSSQKMSVWSNPVCCGEMAIMQWESLHFRMDTAELAAASLSEQTGSAGLSSRLPGVPTAACMAHVGVWEQGLCSSVLFCSSLPVCVSRSSDRCLLSVHPP